MRVGSEITVGLLDFNTGRSGEVHLMTEGRIHRPFFVAFERWGCNVGWGVEEPKSVNAEDIVVEFGFQITFGWRVPNDKPQDEVVLIWQLDGRSRSSRVKCMNASGVWLFVRDSNVGYAKTHCSITSDSETIDKDLTGLGRWDVWLGVVCLPGVE